MSARQPCSHQLLCWCLSLGTGMMVEHLKQEGTSQRLVKMGASWLAESQAGPLLIFCPSFSLPQLQLVPPDFSTLSQYFSSCLSGIFITINPDWKCQDRVFGGRTGMQNMARRPYDEVIEQFPVTMVSKVCAAVRRKCNTEQLYQMKAYVADF
ncbi:hypothetical protein AMECASPLE_010066 [Ameca splendens]|uniref:Uncharacterized protein n=1 Tax=Ameca splendens TaxID=208324 RepID=A0ABV0XDF4_9TELE